jgi:catechol 2,3-dioxygenase-like lactoylglutathione lyase family enzyme
MIIIENIDHISFPVSDMDRSIEFYREVFGFDVVEHMSGSPDALLQVGDIRLRLQLDKNAKGEGGYVAFYVDEEDFEDALDEIEENGIETLSAAEEYRGGKRIVVLDPDGNKIGLCYSRK